MAIRTDLPRIPTNEKPSYFNIDTAVGFFTGGVVGNLVFLGAAAVILGVAFAAATPAAMLAALPMLLLAGAAGVGIQIAGTVMGAQHGKKQMEQDLAHGRAVHEPTFLNKGTVLGIVAADFAVTVASFLFPPLALLSFPAAIAGGIAGSVWRKDEMQKDVSQAEMIQLSQGKDSLTPLRMRTVSHAEAQELDARMNHGASHGGHADRLDQSRATPHQQQLS
jgi:hypothetical protein